MVCTRPIRAWMSKDRNRNGKQYLVFKEIYSDGGRPLDIPCGRCDACLLERSRQWAVRAYHEASLHVDNCFVTLTYRPESLPRSGSVSVRELQLFFKKLRKKLDCKIRYFACGEYGEKFSRPHYHACIFGWFPSDAVFWKNERGNQYFLSKVLADTWGLGFTSVGKFSFETAAYVARYVCKKAFGVDAPFRYGTVDSKTGEIIQTRTPEFVTMSRKPGLGADWVSFYHEEMAANDAVSIRGVKSGIPKYYDKLSALLDPEELEERKEVRKKKRKVRDYKRLGELETSLKIRTKTLQRGYENGSI